MEFTGERLVPEAPGTEDLYHEHLIRYLFAQQFAPGKTVLDIGCGCGYGSCLLAEGGAETVIGVDISEEAIRYSKEHYSARGLDFEVMDCTNLKFPNRTFDLVVAFEIIEHIPNCKGLLSEAKRVLKGDGVFIVSTPNRVTYPPGNPFHVKEFFLQEFVELLKESFISVVVYDQDYLYTLIIHNHHSEKRALNTSLGTVQGEENWVFFPLSTFEGEEPDYFVALCQEERTPLDLFAPAGQVWNYICEVSTVRFEERTEWALRLDKEIEQRDQRIVQLQGELEERTDWALRLDKEVEQRDGRIVQLQGEFEGRTEWALEQDQYIERLQKELMRIKQTWYHKLFGEGPVKVRALFRQLVKGGTDEDNSHRSERTTGE